MLHRTVLGPLHKRFQPLILRILRAPIMWVCLVVVLAIPTFILVTNRAVPAKTPTPADLFMQSVVKRDAAMGWHQLCSSVQAQVPLAALAGQVEKQRIAEAGEGLTLTVDYIGAHAQPQGGQIRLYVVTAHRPDGWVGQRTYIVYTQVGGCVEDVKSS
jgi:hypothetical protein